MGSPTLGRLVDPARFQELLGASPSGVAMRLVDGSGAAIAASPGAEAVLGGDGGADLVRRPIVADGAIAGEIIARAGAGTDPATARSAAELVGRAIDLVVVEALARRAIATAAIDDLRELALLSRLSATLATTTDPTEVARHVLESVSRPLHPVAGIVLDADGTSVLASSGPADAVATLLSAAPPLVARLRAEDPIVG